jgi:outer membrane receptor protein involved in Fe transport
MAPGDYTPPTPLVEDDSYALGVYADDQIQIADKLKFVAGARADRNTRLDSEKAYLGGRMGLIYEPTDTWITKLVYNRAIRFPSMLASMNSVWGKDIPSAPDWAHYSNPATRPEILSTIEWENVFYIGETRLGVTAYYEDLRDFISWAGPHTNVGDFSGYGIEANIQAPITRDLSFWGNASWNHASLRPFVPRADYMLTNNDERIMGSPDYTVNMGLEYKISKNLIFSPAFRYFTEQAAFSLEENDFITIRNRFYLDATLVWKDAFVKNMDLRVSVMNMLDNRDEVASQWMIRDTYTPRGITATLSLEYKF